MKEVRNTDSLNQTNPESRLVEGYAVVFNSRSIDLGGFYEVIDQNALNGVLERSDVVCLLDHDKKRGVLARSRSGKGSLNLTVDERGLYFSFEAPKTSLGDEILEGVRRGDISSCSFAFTVKEDEFRKEDDGTILRTIKSIDKLYDISLVYTPCYEATQVDTRSFDAFIENSKQDNNINNMEVQKNEEIRNQEETTISNEVENRNDEDVKEKEVEEKNCETNPDDKEEKSDEKEEDVKEKEEEKSDENENENEEDKKEEEERSQKTETKENIEQRNNNKSNYTHNIMEKRFSLINTINDVINNRSFNETSKEIINRSMAIAKENGVDFGSDQIVLSSMVNKEQRGVQNPNGILAQEPTYGQEAVPTELFDIVGALRDKMVLSQAGARFINVTGNIEIPVYSGATCTWEDEIGEAKDGSGKFSSVKLAPRRITAVLPISRLFLAQTSESAEALLREDLINAVSEKLQKTILGDGAGSDVEPKGLMNGVVADAADFEYSEAVNIEEYLESKNFATDNAKWVVSPSAKAILRTAKVDAGSGRFVMENNEVLGVPAYSTSSMVDNGVIYGDFSELIIANWDSMSILVDPYTLAAKNQIRLVVHFYVNYVLRREDALVKRVIKKN